MTTTPALRRRRFWVACAAALVGLVAVGAALGGAAPPGARALVSGWAMVVAGVLACVSGARASLLSRGMRRRGWLLLTTAGGIGVLGNLSWTLATKSVVHPLDAFANGCTSLATVLAILAVLQLPTTRARGTVLALMALDGAIVAGALMSLASMLVYAPVLESAEGTLGARVTALALPVLDVLLVTVCTLLVSRSRSDAAVLVLVGLGFLVYAGSDLIFAVLAARGDFEFGTPVDLGWIAGYLLLGLAAWHHTALGDTVEDAAPRNLELRYTVAVFSVLVLAVTVRILAGGRLTVTQTVLWLVLVAVAFARQVVLAVDNAGLRRSLERRVEEQTRDLGRLARQNEVLLTSVGDGIYGVDLDGRITFINPPAAESLHFAAEELLGRRAHQEFHAPQDDGAPYPWTGCYVTEAIRHGVVSTSEEDVYVRKDGTTFPVEITSSPILDEDRLTGAVVVFRDVTQRREVDRLKNEFLSMVSHELRTPLTSIRGALGLLAAGAAGDMPAAAGRMTRIALESSERLTRLINDILDVERLESGTLPMRVGVHAVDGLLAAAAAELAELARSAAVSVVVSPASGSVVVDRDRVLQTLTNLIGNAVKFSQPGSEVHLDAVATGREIVLRVCDTGRGIPEEKLDRIFDRFEQVDSSDARLQGGTGLGLAISRGIVERLGGRIWVESELGRGTTMHVALPAAPSDASAADAGQGQVGSAGGGPAGDAAPPGESAPTATTSALRV